MLEHFKGDEEFVRKVLDYRTQAVDHQRLVLTKFLDPHQREIVHDVVGASCEIYEEGGFINAENKRMILAPDFYEIVPEDFKINVYQVKYSDKFEHLEHRDILGALMHLGIDRSCFGDICKDPLAFAVASENAGYVEANLTKVRRSMVHLIPHDFSLEIVNQYRRKEFVVSSLRLDKIIATFFGLSRAKAMEAIASESVKVNYKMIDQTDYLCNNNDIISFRKHGRVKMIVTPRVTRSQNLVVEGLFYL